jgi:drug/metabolite transporter (DMT)-like permease
VLIPVVWGVTFFHERPAATQLAGVAMVVGGLLLLGLG